ncbi:MAG TPA: Hsp20/alpha crystallin family protein [Candidatus Paceibacterota bacterium]|nr:Hsp20/alpha crystallin family protein [Candidatus Paceibacterota bacterium]
MKKRSIFDRLAGTVPLDDYDYDDELPARAPARQAAPQPMMRPAAAPQPLQHHIVEEETEGQLPVDVYQTPNEIVIRTFVAGVRPDDLNVSISRDMVVIEGSRDERDQLPDSDYFTRELFWGSFSRTILLPQEIDVDMASAGAKDGLLSIILPKLDKTRQTKLKVRAA